MSATLEKFLSTRSFSEKICEPLFIEDYLAQPVDFASPPKWHLAHTTWFYEEMILKKYIPDFKIFHPDFSFLFNSYYQNIGKRAIRNQRGLITRPAIDQIYEYRKYIDSQIAELIKANDSEELNELIILGINHEQQHQELLITDLKHTFYFNPIYPVYKENFSLITQFNSDEGWVSISAGNYWIGYEGDEFCFDNEKSRHQVYLQDYQISKSLVTNGEFIEFIEAGGYENFKYWLDEGWTWVQENQIDSPLYWEKIEDEWYYYTLGGLIKVDKDAILAHVSFYEAHAFANFKNCRLPTEMEWETANSKFKWGTRWEWTYSSYLPYPQFKIADGALGEYNGKFMIGMMVLRGASTATPKGHSRETYRNFFHPKYRWQVSGIRLAK